MRAIQQRVTGGAVGTVAAESALGMDTRRWLAESCRLRLRQPVQAASRWAAWVEGNQESGMRAYY